MTNVEARRNARICIIGTPRSRLRHSGFHSPSSFVIRASSFRAEGAVTIVELLVVITIILILAGLILSIGSYVQNKGARARAETEIAAMSAALESYKADNGIYPRDNTTTGYTDGLNARQILRQRPRPRQMRTPAQVFILYSQLSGLDQNQQPVTGMKSYFTFRPQMLGHPPGNTITVTYIRDPFGNSYGYSTANQGSSSAGYNPTFDLWSAGSIASPTPTPPVAWIKNW